MTLTKTTYRSTTQIMADLLVATDESGLQGIKTTSLLTKVNLSHGRLQKFIATLTSSGLINRIEYDGRNTFVITPEGRLFVGEYHRFQELTSSFGLDL